MHQRVLDLIPNLSWSPGSLCLAWIFVVMMAGPGWSQTSSGRQPTHADLVRWKYEATKVTSPDKGGGEGDAAVSSDRYDVLRYGLDLRIDPVEASIIGAVEMVFASDVPDLQSYVFDFTDDLLVTSIDHLNGSLPFTHNGDSVVVMLPTLMALDEVDSLTVHYRGEPQEPSFNRGLMYRNYNLGGHLGESVASMSQPAYAKYWWPCKDKPGDKAVSTVRITVPDHLVGVSNGTLEGVYTPEAGWSMYSWREDYPIASYLISVAIADYVVLTDHCSTSLGSEIPIYNWVFPPDEEDAEVDFAPLCEMMEVCEGFFGHYPFQGEKYGHAEFLWTGAMEHQTATSIGYGSLLGDGSHDWLIVHELGHQWFGDSLTPDTWADIWLNEGLATYTEALWIEHLYGHEAYMNALRHSRVPGIWAVQGPVYDPVPVFPGRVIYDKGAWIVHMLRGRLGDDVFFQMLEDWSQGGGRPLATVTTQEFIDHASDWAGQELDTFLWPYLREIEIPQVAFSFGVADGTAGVRTQVEVNLQQSQSTLFDNVFPVVVTTAAGQETFSVRLSEATATAVLEASAEVLDVELDPEGWVLWEPVGTAGPTLGIIAGYPNPSIDGYVQFRFKMPDPAEVTLRIFDVRGREIDSRNLGWVLPQADYNEVAWNEKDKDGHPVGSGVYWVALEIGDERSVRKFTVIR